MEPAVEYCYMCGAVATTVEHAPPKCLFPEAKDTPGADFRKNLITVPSCIEHNCSKSSDDEFLMVSIAGIVGNNSIGYHHATGKVDRALRRSSYRLLNKVFHKKEILRIEKEDNEFIDFIIGTPDYARLKRCFNSMLTQYIDITSGTASLANPRLNWASCIAQTRTPEHSTLLSNTRWRLSLRENQSTAKTEECFTTSSPSQTSMEYFY